MQVDPAEAMRSSEHTLPELLAAAEAGGDARVLARVHGARAMTEWMRSRAASALEALESAIAHARRAGDPALVAEMRGFTSGPIVLGPAPAHEIRRWIEATEDDDAPPMVRSGLELAAAALALMEYRVDDARAHHAVANGILRDMGFTLLLSSSGQNTARVALVEGDTSEAVRLLRASYEAGARLRDRSYHATTAAYLGEALRRAGQLDEAERIALESEAESAPEDVVNFAIAWATRGLIAGARGRLDEALDLTRRAVEHAELTDFPITVAEAYVAHGDVLRRAGRDAEAAAVFVHAAAVAEAKGDQPMADRARAVAAGAPA
jgi:tetratricopeptide (TPR) repeat protein